MNQRKQLLVLAMEYRIAKEGGRTTRELQPGSATVAENAALREGNTLDALFAEYEAYLPRFQAFTDSATAKLFFAALEPALRTEFALSSTATTDFAEQEFGRYFGRWRSVYGPAMRMTTRTTVMIRGRTVSITHTTQGTINPYGSAEAMAIQCEQRESVSQPYRNVRDGNAQAADFRAIQNRCRAEQRLPPL